MTARGIEKQFGSGWFPVRLAHANAFSFRFVGADGVPINPLPFYGHLSNRLTYMAAVGADAWLFQWMNDLLFMALFAPEELILREAGPRNSWWHRVGRKRKANILLNQQKAYADALSDEQEIAAREARRETARNRAQWEGAVRRDRCYSTLLPVQITPNKED